MTHTDDLLAKFHDSLSTLKLEEQGLREEMAELESCLGRLLGKGPKRKRPVAESARPDESQATAPEGTDLQDGSLLESLVAASPSFIHLWCLDAGGNYIFANRTAAAAFGLNPESIKGRQVDQLRPARSEASATLDRGVLETGLPSFGQVETVQTSAGPRWIRVNRLPWKDPSGSVAGVLAFGLDITEMRNVEKTLSFSENRAKTLFENAVDAIWLHDLEGRFKEVNAILCQRLGYTRQELLSLPLEQVLAPEFRPRLPERMAHLRQEGYLNTEAVHLRKDGSRVHVQVSAWLIESEEGRLVLCIARDITGQKAAETQLKLSEERFLQVAESAGEWIWEVDPDGLYTYCSPAVHGILGYRPEELVGKMHFWDLFAPEVRESLQAAAMEAFARREAIHALPNPNLRKDGREVHLETTGVPFFDAGGEFRGYRGADKDVTERKRAEEALERSESLFRTVVENCAEGIGIIDFEENFAFANPAAERIFGVEPGDLVGRCLKAFVDPEALLHVLAQTKRRAEGETSEYQLPIRRPNGEIRTLHVTATPLRGSHGKVDRTLGIFRDFTERMKAEEALREAHQFNDQIIRSAQEGIIVYGPDLRYLAWNPFMEQLTGLPAGEVVGKHPLELFPFLKDAGVIDRLERALAGGVTDPVDFPYRIPASGRSGWTTDVSAPFRNSKGEIIGVIGTVNDITARKEAEEKIRQFNESLEAQVQARTQDLQQERDFTDSLIQASPTYFVALSPDGQVLLMNEALLRASGFSQDQIRHEGFFNAFIAREGRAAMHAAYQEVRHREAGAVARVPIRTASGIALQVEWRIRAVRNPEGKILHFFGVGIDITDRLRQEKLQEFRTRILQTIIAPVPLQAVFELLIHHVQEIWADHPVSLCLLDAKAGTLHNAANSGLPGFYLDAIEGLSIGPQVGACGAASFTGRRVVCENLQTHPHWTPFRKLAAQAGLGACWSEPILSAPGQVLGTFAVYARQPERPAEADLQLLQEAVSLASLAIEHKQSEMELALRNAAVQAAADAIVITDGEGVVQWANAAFGGLTGYLPEEIQGQHIRILKSGRHDRTFYKQLWDTVLSGRVWKGELANRRKDGSEFTEEQTITPVHGEGGAITHFVAIKRDVSARKAAEVQLRKLSQAIEQSPSTVVITDVNGIIEYVNPHFQQMTGYTPQEALGKTPRVLKSGLTPPQVYKEMWDTITSGAIWRGELVNRHRNGQLFWEKIAIAPLFDNLGRITHFVANTEDVTGKRLMEETHQRLSMALEQAADAAAILELDGTVVFANPAFHKVLGVQDRLVIGEPITAFLEDPQNPGRLGEMLAQARGERPWKGRHTVAKADGARIILDGTLSPVRDPEGGTSGLVAVFRDVTKEIERGKQLLQAQKMESLGALAGGVAHDFNNILSAILTATELIEWQLEPDSPIHSKLDIIYQVSQQARELNRQILSFSRRSEEKRIPFDLSGVVREAIRLLKLTIPKNVSLKSEVSSSVWVAGDPAQAHQVVLNLAINGCHAIGDRIGSLHLSLAERDLTEADGLPVPAGRYSELSIQDTGSGMDAETLERIFEPFFTTKPEGEGTGLGLSVVHGIIHGHGGHITVESALGKGTTFRVFLPCSVAEIPSSAATQAEATYGTERILLVDDEDIVTALAKQGLEGLGYHVVAKTSPADALEVFQSQPGAFDLLMTDLVLPGFSGAELTRRIRRLRPELPAILMTGTLQAFDSAPDYSVAFDEILAKPLAAKELAAAVRRVMDTRNLLPDRDSYPEAEVAQDAADRPSILLAEDDPVTCLLLHTWLAKAGYRVQEAKDGQEAWELYSAAQNRAPYSLVLTDIVMPRMDGLELLERIRKADPDVPVVILSSVTDGDTAKKALHLHVNGYLMKPFNSHALIGTVARLLDKGISSARKEMLEETAQAVRMAHRVMEAVPEKDVPIFSICEPLTDAGGDVFRSLRRPDGTILFLLADVAGHSVMSSYAVASFLGILSTFMQEDLALDTLFLRLNRAIQEGPFPDIPIASLAANWCPRTGRLHVINAGIPYGILHRKALQRTDTIPLDGAPLGLFDLPRVSEKVGVLEPGDRLLFATDGLLDLVSMTGISYRELAPPKWQELSATPVPSALSAIYEAAKTHGQGRINDDILAIAMEQPEWLPKGTELIRVVPSNLDAIEHLCEEFKTFLQDQPLTRNLNKIRRFEVLLALREALSNAHRHGNRRDSRERIALHASLEAHSLLVRVVDGGQGFEIKTQQQEPDTASEGGRGITILQSMTSSLRMHAGELEFRIGFIGAADGREN